MGMPGKWKDPDDVYKNSALSVWRHYIFYECVQTLQFGYELQLQVFNTFTGWHKEEEDENHGLIKENCVLFFLISPYEPVKTQFLLLASQKHMLNSPTDNIFVDVL